MTKQWLREYRLLVTDDSGATNVVDLSDYRAVFHISQSLNRKVCTAEITVYNVAPSTINLVRVPINKVSEPKQRSYVEIWAGYDGDAWLIFKGELWWKTTGRENATDTYMRLVASIGNSGWNYAVMNQSFPKGTSQAQIFDAIAKSLADHELATSGTPKNLMPGELPRGKVIFQPTRIVLDKFADTNNLYYGFGTPGMIIAQSGDAVDKQEEVHEVNAGTGMIGVPRLTVEGIHVQMLLNPKIEVNSYIRLNNDSITRANYNTDVFDQNLTADNKMLSNDGYYRVISREHEGDTHGDSWFTNVICIGAHADLKFFSQSVLEMGSNG